MPNFDIPGVPSGHLQSPLEIAVESIPNYTDASQRDALGIYLSDGKTIHPALRESLRNALIAKGRDSLSAGLVLPVQVKFVADAELAMANDGIRSAEWFVTTLRIEFPDAINEMVAAIFRTSGVIEQFPSAVADAFTEYLGKCGIASGCLEFLHELRNIPGL